MTTFMPAILVAMFIYIYICVSRVYCSWPCSLACSTLAVGRLFCVSGWRDGHKKEQLLAEACLLFFGVVS